MRSAVALTLAAGVGSACGSDVIGYYSWNWGSGSQGPPGANMGVAFTGLSDVQKAIAQYTPGAAWCCPALKGSKTISIGGGNSAGTMSADILDQITTNMGLIPKANYTAIIFDVEEVDGAAATVVPKFQAAFKAAKAAGLTVAVTTSHSAPYQTATPQDAVDIVKAWAADSNIDILSPQLYSSGSEGAPEFAETSSCKDAGCVWELYKPYKGVFAPSIVSADQYAQVKSFFSSNYSITCGGYFEWKQRA